MISFVLNSLLLGVGLAMDAFSVSIANGLREPDMGGGRQCLIAGIYGFFQFLMPVIGWFCVHMLVRQFRAFEPFIPWIALALLAWIGGRMVLEGVRQAKAGAPTQEKGAAGATAEGAMVGSAAGSVAATAAQSADGTVDGNTAPTADGSRDATADGSTAESASATVDESAAATVAESTTESMVATADGSTAESASATVDESAAATAAESTTESMVATADYDGAEAAFTSSGQERIQSRPGRGRTLGMGILLAQGIATSIDALSVGFAIAGYSAAAALVSAMIIGAVTFLICMGGLTAGLRLGRRLSWKAGILGGCILIFIGLEIFVRGVFL